MDELLYGIDPRYMHMLPPNLLDEALNRASLDYLLIYSEIFRDFYPIAELRKKSDVLLLQYSCRTTEELLDQKNPQSIDQTNIDKGRENNHNMLEKQSLKMRQQSIMFEHYTLCRFEYVINVIGSFSKLLDVTHYYILTSAGLINKLKKRGCVHSFVFTILNNNNKWMWPFIIYVEKTYGYNCLGDITSTFSKRGANHPLNNVSDIPQYIASFLDQITKCGFLEEIFLHYIIITVILEYECLFCESQDSCIKLKSTQESQLHGTGCILHLNFPEAEFSSSSYCSITDFNNKVHYKSLQYFLYHICPLSLHSIINRIDFSKLCAYADFRTKIQNTQHFPHIALGCVPLAEITNPSDIPLFVKTPVQLRLIKTCRLQILEDIECLKRECLHSSRAAVREVRRCPNYDEIAQLTTQNIKTIQLIEIYLEILLPFCTPTNQWWSKDRVIFAEITCTFYSFQDLINHFYALIGKQRDDQAMILLERTLRIHSDNNPILLRKLDYPFLTSSPQPRPPPKSILMTNLCKTALISNLCPITKIFNNV